MVPRTVEEAKSSNVSCRPYMNLCMPFIEYMIVRKSAHTLARCLDKRSSHAFTDFQPCSWYLQGTWTIDPPTSRMNAVHPTSCSRSL